MEARRSKATYALCDNQLALQRTSQLEIVAVGCGKLHLRHSMTSSLELFAIMTVNIDQQGSVDLALAQAVLTVFCH